MSLKRLLCLLFLISTTASAGILTPWGSLDPAAKNTVPASMLTMKGVGSDLIYPVEIDPTIGAIPVTGLVAISGGTITATNPSVGTTGTAVPTSATMIGGTDGADLRAAHVSATGLVSVDASGTTVPVSGTFFQTTQPVSGTVAVNNFPATQPVSGSVSVSNFPATQPISGTVTANAGTGNFNVTQATGTNLHVVVDSAPTTAVTGTFFQATQPVSGTVTANGGTGNFQVIQPTASSLNATVVQSVGSNLHVDVDSAPTTTVTGTVTATSNQSGTWTVQPGNTANTTPWLVTANAGTGTFTTSDLGDGSVNGGTAGTKSILGGGIYNSSAPTLTNGQQASLQFTSAGALITSAGSVATTAGTFQDGSIAFGSLTTSFATVVTTGGVVKHVDMRNGTNATVLVSLNAGSSTSYTLDAGDQVSLDLAVNGSNIAASTALQAKYSGTAPTSGSIHINDFY